MAQGEGRLWTLAWLVPGVLARGPTALCSVLVAQGHPASRDARAPPPVVPGSRAPGYLRSQRLSAVLGFSPCLILYGVGAAAEPVVEERCLTNRAVSALVAELAQPLVPSHFASLAQTALGNLSSPHDPAAERGASSLAMGLEGAWGSLGQSRGLAPGCACPESCRLAAGAGHQPAVGF